MLYADETSSNPNRIWYQIYHTIVISPLANFPVGVPSPERQRTGAPFLTAAACRSFSSPGPRPGDPAGMAYGKKKAAAWPRAVKRRTPRQCRRSQ
jgi:hypothetical protein